jgi:pimeloyl-ACP methyl ester carboxylesterase
MTTPNTAELAKFADLQMAAEAFLVEGPENQLKQDLVEALEFGNDHASKFTTPQAIRFLQHWKVVAQLPNTKTGFSGTVFRCISDDPLTGAKAGETVLSLRSTEFVDDAARDNQATNTMEVAKTGFAWGQLRDMEAWYQQLLREGKLVAGQFSVTGYSLGGHLATAFSVMHNSDVKQVVAFNGAGIGGYDPTKSLKSLVDTFADKSIANTNGSSKFSFSNSVINAIFARARTSIQGGGLMSDADRNALIALINSYGSDASVSATDKADAERLGEAADRVKIIRGEINRLSTGINNPRKPAQWAADKVAQYDLDYQLAVLTVAQSTDATGLLVGLVQTYKGTVVRNPLSNQFDVQGDTSPSAVANSQNHVGTDVKVFIEDQPLWRGGFVGAVVAESLRDLQNGGIKLLVDDRRRKDFGDTHSLVLMVDSLAVQNTFLGMMATATPVQRDAASRALQDVLKDASNRRTANGDALLGANQGKAEGNVLEKLVNALAALVLGPGVDIHANLTRRFHSNLIHPFFSFEGSRCG